MVLPIVFKHNGEVLVSAIWLPKLILILINWILSWKNNIFLI